MKILSVLILIVFQFVTFNTSAQNRPGYSTEPGLREFTQNGELVSIRIVIGEPLRIFVVGKEEAKLNLSDLQLTVRRLKPYPGQTLTTNLKDDHFIVSEPGEFKETTDLAITTKIKNKSETLNFKINQKLP